MDVWSTVLDELVQLSSLIIGVGLFSFGLIRRRYRFMGFGGGMVGAVTIGIIYTQEDVRGLITALSTAILAFVAVIALSDNRELRQQQRRREDREHWK